LCRHHDQFVEAGGRIVAVGQGTAAETAAFASELELPYTVLGDPDREGYRAYGLTEGGAAQFLSLSTLAGYWRAFRSGAGMTKPVGNVRQLPGTFVIDATGVVQYSHPGSHAADTPSADELLARVRSV
jgi:peroxiredoxin